MAQVTHTKEDDHDNFGHSRHISRSGNPWLCSTMQVLQKDAESDKEPEVSDIDAHITDGNEVHFQHCAVLNQDEI